MAKKIRIKKRPAEQKMMMRPMYPNGSVAMDQAMQAAKMDRAAMDVGAMKKMRKGMQ